MSHSFGPNTALDSLSFELTPGGITALLGLNGAGKTTALRILLGLVRPASGKIRCFGAKPGSTTARAQIGVVFQQAGLPADLSVEELLQLHASYRGDQGFESVAHRLDLRPLLPKRYGQLSGGQQRIVQFALALLGQPSLLVLDEPTTGLDPDARRTLWNHLLELSAQQHSVLLTTHYLDEADRLADRVLVVHQGRLIADARPSELKARTTTKTIRCRTQLETDALRGLSGVIHVERDGAEVRVQSAAAEETLRELFARDATVEDLTVSGRDLESALRGLTRGAEGRPS